MFQREPGYFLGAVVIGYALAVPMVAGFGFLIHWLAPALDWEWCFAIAFALYLGLTPAMFRYARTIWIYTDNRFDPPEVR